MRERAERFRIGGKRLERIRIGGERRHRNGVLGQGCEIRILRERAEGRVADHCLECVRLHQFGHRSVTQGDILVADLRIHVALRSADCARAGPERRINPPEAVRPETDSDHRRAG